MLACAQFKMFRILLLFIIFQVIKSDKKALTNRYNIALTHINIVPINCKTLKVSFKAKNEVQHLNGKFSVHHGNKEVGKTKVNLPVKEDQKINIICKLSPCNSYRGIEIRPYQNNGDFKRADKNWNARAFQNCCPTTATTTTITATTILENSTSSASGNSTNPVSEAHVGTAATTGIVVGVVLVALIVTALFTILVKRKRDEKKKRNEEMPVDVNPVYGIYDDGALYNVVEDGNDYYES